MPRIDPLVVVHRLNVSPSFPPICQKKRVFASNQDFIREFYYPDWLANVVMAKKANRK